jgi:hypothetical protein
MRSIAIIVGRNCDLGLEYFLRLIVDCWRESGIEVQALCDPDGRVEEDLAILHVDLTSVPREYLECAQVSPRHQWACDRHLQAACQRQPRADRWRLSRSRHRQA